MNMQVKKAEQDPQHLTVLHIAAFGASAVGLAAFDSYSNDAVFTLALLFMLITGSYYSWQRRIDPKSGNAVSNMVRYALAAGLTVFLAMHVISNRLIDLMSIESSSQTMAVVISAIMIVVSFYLVSDEMLLFSCIPALSLIGLTGTMGQDEGVIVYFGVYLALASLLIMRQNLISGSSGKTHQTMPFGVHAGIAAAITAVALILAWMFYVVIYTPIDRKILSHLMGPMSLQSVMVQDINDAVQVGPSPTASSEELMTVRCSEPLLWRGQTFNYYNGAVWRDRRPFMGEALRDYGTSPVVDPDFGWPAQSVFKVPEDKADGKRRSVKAVEQLFQITNGQYRLVFTAADPETISFDAGQSLFKSVRLIGTSRFRGRGSRYKSVSLVSTASPTELRAASRAYPPRIKEWYLETPPLEYDVRELSKQICRRLENPYDRAVAIQDYLEQNYTYDLYASMSRGESDIISDFLFKTKKGHCTLFATAMAMLSRHAGIPARLATGFNAGQYDEKDGLYHLSAENKHAWAELYFPSYGWIAFDPTAANANIGLKERVVRAAKALAGYIVGHRTTLLILAVVALLAGYLIKAELLDRLRGKRESAHGAASTSKAVVNYGRMRAILARYEFAKDPAATPLEYADWIRGMFDGELVWISSLVDAVTSDLISVRYAATEVPVERLNLNANHVKNLPHGLKSAKRNNKLAAMQEKVNG